MVAFDLKKQKLFNYGQFYVVLTYAKSLLGLIAVKNLKKETIKAHPNVIKEYERFRSHSNAVVDKRSNSSQKFITLLNIQSVYKHVAVSDCFADARLIESPIICFTETETSENVHILFTNFVLRFTYDCPP